MLYSVKSQNTKVSINQLPPEAWTIISGGDTGKPADDLMRRVAFLYRAAEVRANGVASVEWQIDGGDKEAPRAVHDAPLPSQLGWLDGIDDLAKKTAMSLAGTGKAYWHVERNHVRPLGVRWLTPGSIKPLRSKKNGKIYGFERLMKNGQRVTFEMDEIIHFWLPDYGVEDGPPTMYPAKAAMSGAGVLLNLDDFLEMYFGGGMVATTLLTVSGVVSTHERERLKSWWRSGMTGLRNAFRTEVVQADTVTPVRVGEGISELGNTSLVLEKREDIAAAMGVPHSLIMANAANYATAQQDELNFLNYTVLPELKLIQSVLNDQLFARYEPNLQWRFLPERLEAYQRGELEKAEAVQRVVGKAVLTVNEGRAVLGYDPVEGGDDLHSEPEPVGMLPAPAAEAEVPAAKSMLWYDDMRRFKRWYVRRLGADVAEFNSNDLSHADKIVAADEVMRQQQENYP